VKHFKLIFLIFISATSCDPPHNIVFVNDGQSIAKIRIQVDTTSETNEFRHFDQLAADSLVIEINPSETFSLDFGIGTWSDNEIKVVANSIKALEIENDDFLTIYKSRNRIEQLLIENRKNKIGWETEIIYTIK